MLRGAKCQQPSINCQLTQGNQRTHLFSLLPPPQHNHCIMPLAGPLSPLRLAAPAAAVFMLHPSVHIKAVNARLGVPFSLVQEVAGQYGSQCKGINWQAEQTSVNRDRRVVCPNSGAALLPLALPIYCHTQSGVTFFALIFPRHPRFFQVAHLCL